MATNAVSFVAADKSWFSITDAAQSGLDIRLTDLFINCWLKWTNNSATQVILCTGGTGAAVAGYYIRIDATGHVIASLSNGSSVVTATATTALTSGTMQMVSIGFDRDGNLCILIDGSDAGGAASIAALSASIENTRDFFLGITSATGTSYLNALLQDLSIHSRLLTAAEVSFMYNSGTPYKYNAWGIAGTDGAQLKVGLVSYWYLNASGTTAADSHGTNTLTLSAAAIISPTVYGSELLTNGGFETVTSAGPPANFGTWVENAGDGNVEVETTLKHGGTNAVKFTAGASGDAFANIYPSVTAGTTYRLALWTAGDGTNAGRYAIWDNSNSANILATASTDVTANSYALVTYDFTAPTGCSQLRITVRCPSTNGAIAYFDDVSLKAVSTAGILNGGFETWTASTNAANWTESTAGTSTVTREDTVVYSGTNAAALNVDGSNSNVKVTQSILTAGKTYSYSIYARGSVAANMSIGDDSGSGLNTHLTTTSFVAYASTFTATTAVFRIGRGADCASKTIYADSLTLTAANILTGTGLDGAAVPDPRVFAESMGMGFKMAF